MAIGRRPEFLTTWGSAQGILVTRLMENGVLCTSYTLIMKVPYHHFCHVYRSYRLTQLQCVREQRKGVKTRR